MPQYWSEGKVWWKLMRINSSPRWWLVKQDFQFSLFYKINEDAGIKSHLSGIGSNIIFPQISSKTQHVDVVFWRFLLSLQQLENVKKILGYVVILLEEQDETIKCFDWRNLAENPICFPPPVMLGLCELRLSVVTVSVWPESVGAGVRNSSENKLNQLNK